MCNTTGARQKNQMLSACCGDAAPWRPLIEGAEGIVESAQAAEVRRHGNLRHRKLCVMNQLFGKSRAAFERRLRWTRPPRVVSKSRRNWRSPMPTRVARASTVPSSRSRKPSAISANARETVFEVPRQQASSGEISGRQRRHARKPASCAAAEVGKNRQFSRLGVRAGQIGRQ